MPEVQDSMASWLLTSELSGVNSAYLDAMYEDYLDDPNSVDQSWRAYFDSIRQNYPETSHHKIRQDLVAWCKKPKNAPSTRHVCADDPRNYPGGGNKISAIMDLIHMYRSVGHKMAKLDPLGIKKLQKTEELTLEFHGLSSESLYESFNVGIFSDYQALQLQNIIDKLQNIYTGTIGYQYMHLSTMDEKLWIRQRIENVPRILSADKKRWILERLTAAEGLEKYLGMKYVGQKRFSLEGGESLIPSLNEIIIKAGNYDIKEVSIGMAHRGRLNVLVNIMGKSPEDLFKEFEGLQDEKFLSGDVKYHLGFASWHKTPKNNIRLALAFNPSHLETVDPVVEGAARAKQDAYQQYPKQQIIPILIHGDAAFCGQGVVMETFALSQTRYYGTGGTLHIVINNQVGFTTSKKEDNRSSLYCTDIAKMIEAPVFHVNADDPEAVIKVTELAMDYRMTFNKDVVIDLVCYRRHGHNEADEPSGTQPKMYSVIKQLPTTRVIYSKTLVQEGVLNTTDADNMLKSFRDCIQKGDIVADVVAAGDTRNLKHIVNWKQYVGQKWDQPVSTKMNKAQLVKLANQLNKLPAELQLQPQVKKVVNDRIKMASGELLCNWGFAENLAYASLLDGGFSIRLSGEDFARGTFSHRHAVLHNYDHTNQSLTEYVPLQFINTKVHATIIDSVLSEYAVLGFEYGYSCSAPETLVVWEAQFGDFANTAQVIIDQFIASAEEKWGLLAGLTMLLPHGQEGAGAEHSSARLERFLQMCANDNMQVCVPTTPAQMFHMLRRQMLRQYRKPLIVMSPKSLLRHPLVHSTLDDLADGEFNNVIDEISLPDKGKTSRVLLCCGKVYYDLLSARQAKKIDDIAIIRIEQLYPFPAKAFKTIMKAYGKVSDIVWVQEEPENQGAWLMIQQHIKMFLHKSQRLSCIARGSTSAPAVGYPLLFQAQQNQLVDMALKTMKHKRVAEC